MRFVKYKLPFSIIKLVGNNNISPPCPPNLSTLTSDTVALAPTKLKGSEFKFVFPSVDTISKLPVRFFIGSVCGCVLASFRFFYSLPRNNDNTAIIITKIFKMFLLVMMTLLYNLILNEQAFEVEDLPNKKPARLQAK